MLKKKNYLKREIDDLEKIYEQIGNKLHKLKLEKIRNDLKQEKVKRKKEKNLKLESTPNDMYTSGCNFLATTNVVIAILISAITCNNSKQMEEIEKYQNRANEINLDELDDSFFEYISDWYHFGSNNEYTRFHYYKNHFEPFEEFSYLEIGEKNETGIIVKHCVSFKSIENRIANKEEIRSNLTLPVVANGISIGNWLLVNQLLKKEKQQKKKRVKRKELEL